MSSSLDLYALLISSIIALIGVLVTGFIFLSENIRGIVDSNPAYEHISEVTREYIIKRLIAITVFSIIASIFFIAFAVMPFYNTDSNKWVQDLAVILSRNVDITYYESIFFLRWVLSSVFLALFEASLYYSFKMIKMKDTMDWYTNREIVKYYQMLNKPIVVTLDGEEYNNLIQDSKNEEDSEGSFCLKKAFWFRDVYVYDSRKVFIVSEIRRDEIIKALNKGQYRVCSADSDFDIKQTISVFETVEKILAKLLSVEYLFYKDSEELQAQFSPRMRSWDISSISDDISDRYFKIRDFRDMFQIRRSNTLEGSASGNVFEKNITSFQKDQMKYLELMHVNVFVLLFEVAPHLDKKNLENIDLSEFGASSIHHKFNLSGSNLTNCNMTNTVMSNANLRNAYMYHAKLTDTDLRYTECDGANMSDSIIDNVLFTGATMDGIVSKDSVITNNQFSSLPMNAGMYKDSTFRKNEFSECSILSSNLEGTKIMDTLFDNCLMNKMRLSDSVVSDSEINNSSMTEAILNNAYFSHCQLINSDFSNTIMQEMNVDSVQFRDVDMSKSQVDKTLFKGCQFFATVFDDMVARQARFENSLMTKYLLESRKIPIEGNRIKVTHHQVFNNDQAFLDYCLEYGGKTELGMVAPVKVGAVDNPLVSMNRSILDESLFASVRIEYAMIAGASFFKCGIRDVGFNVCNMSSSNFAKSDLIYSSFIDCNLFQTDFTETYLENCLFLNVTYLDLDRFNESKANGTIISNSIVVHSGKSYHVKSALDLGEMLKAIKDGKWTSYVYANSSSIVIIV